MEKTLKDVYYNIKGPGSLGGVDAVYRVAKAKDKRITKKKVKTWLKSQPTYTLHKPIRRKFKRGRIIVSGIDDRWQADLVDLRSLKKFNNGVCYLNVVIDVFSKYAWVTPLKNKRGIDLVKAFQTIFREGRMPRSLQTDQGTEYMNRNFQKLLRENGIIFFTSKNETKASVVERLNRTLKTKLWHYFTAKSTSQYINVLDDIVRSYNNTFHSSIQMKPIDVTKNNEKEVWENLYGHHSLKMAPRRSKYNVGEQVRISKYKKNFDKGYLRNWTREIFTISQRQDSFPEIYFLQDKSGEDIVGGFYKEEIQPIINDDNVYKIEKIIRHRKRNGIHECLVRWLGYPKMFDSWIRRSTLISL